MRETWFDIAATTAAKVYWLAAGLVITFVTARVLGPDGRGVFAAATAWVTLFSTIGYLSLPQAVIHRAATQRSTSWVAETAGTLVTIYSIVTLAGGGVAAVLYRASGGDAFDHLPGRVLVVAFLTMPFMLWFETGNALLLSIGALRLSNVAQLAGATLSMIAVLVCVGALGWGVMGALLAPLAYYGLYAVVTVGVLLSRAGIARPAMATARWFLASGLKLHLNAVGAYLVSGAHVLIVNAFRTPADTAYIQLALQLLTAMQILPMAAATVASSIIAREGSDRAWRRHRTLLVTLLSIMIVAIPIVYTLAPWLIRLIAGPEFGPAVPLFRVALCAVPGMTVSVLMAPQWIARGYFLTTAAITTALGLASVAGSWIWVPRHGTIAAAWVVVGVYWTSLAVNTGFFFFVNLAARRSSSMEP
ncbi:MAG TPA: hypothetical protein VNA69_05465 [Thermoanaerobaculia bacterium]|nr:hypothetical protein [Thermoanaerobaculia bacterium]